MFALGFVAAGLVLGRRLKELGKPVDWAYEVVFAALMGGVVGARVYYVIQTRVARPPAACSRAPDWSGTAGRWAARRR